MQAETNPQQCHRHHFIPETSPFKAVYTLVASLGLTTSQIMQDPHCDQYLTMINDLLFENIEDIESGEPQHTATTTINILNSKFA